MSSGWINISKIGKVLYHLQPLPRWTKKVGILRSTNLIVIDSNVLGPNGLVFGRLRFGPWGVLPPQILDALEIDLGYLAHPATGTGVPRKKV